MQPLVSIRRIMTWLSMCPSDKSSNARQKNSYVACTLALLFFDFVYLSTSLVFCWEFILIDFESSTFAVMIVIGEIGVLYFIISAISMRHQIGGIFKRLSTIYKDSELIFIIAHEKSQSQLQNKNKTQCSIPDENEVDVQCLTRANTTSEWIWTIYLKYVAVSVIGMDMTGVLTVLYCYFTHERLNSDHFYRAGKLVYVIKIQFTWKDMKKFVDYFSLPWNQATNMGYFGEMLLCTFTCTGYLISNGIPLVLFLSLCVHHQAFAKIFKHKSNKSVKCDAKMLCGLINFHISAKE